MLAAVDPLRDKRQTAARMYQYANDYHKDLLRFRTNLGRPLGRIPPLVFFDFVRRIPYREDEQPVEIVARPAHIVKYRNMGMDCKKKALLMLAFARCQRPPIASRLIASSNRPSGEIHHCFPQLFLAGAWRNFDATYPDAVPFALKKVTAYAIL